MRQPTEGWSCMYDAGMIALVQGDRQSDQQGPLEILLLLVRHLQPGVLRAGILLLDGGWGGSGVRGG